MRRYSLALIGLLAIPLAGCGGGGGSTVTNPIGSIPSNTGFPVNNSAPVITTSDGLQYQDETVGTGNTVATGKAVTISYTGFLTNGTIFDSNVDPSFGHTQPLGFTVGAGQVIQGLDEGVVGMKVGGVRLLKIPANLAYGANPPSGSKIPANATLFFFVEMASSN